jgi:eukaryotic-like serine/threonine-protein kinase
MNKILRLLVSRLFWINLAIAIVVTALIILGVFWGLGKYTDHGAAYTVPDFTGMQMEEVIKICEEKDFQYNLLDSVYNDDVEPGAVVEQSPEPGSKVKKGQTIFLKTNALGLEMVEMPELEGVSLRQAKAILETYGLVGGNLRYVPDIASNVVIRQQYKGDDIESGTKVPKGSSIDLILGIGLSDEKTFVPDLKGLTRKQASNKLLDMYLNAGAIVFDNTVKDRNDSIEARVFRQSPKNDTINKINLGSNVDIWLTTDTTLWKPQLEEDIEPETE